MTTTITIVTNSINDGDFVKIEKINNNTGNVEHTLDHRSSGDMSTVTFHDGHTVKITELKTES